MKCSLIKGYIIDSPPLIPRLIHILQEWSKQTFILLFKYPYRNFAYIKVISLLKLNTFNLSLVVFVVVVVVGGGVDVVSFCWCLKSMMLLFNVGEMLLKL